MTLKEKCHTQLLTQLSDQINELQKVSARLNEDKSGETKSVVGDKYETARAMIQMEEDQIKGRLNLLSSNVAKVKMLDPTLKNNVVEEGALVKMNIGYFYISVAMSKMKVDDQTIFFMSADAPLAKSLNGIKKEGSITFNGKSLVIEEVF